MELPIGSLRKIKSLPFAVSYSMAEGLSFGVSPKDGCLYVGPTEELKRVGVILDDSCVEKVSEKENTLELAVGESGFRYEFLITSGLSFEKARDLPNFIGRSTGCVCICQERVWVRILPNGSEKITCKFYIEVPDIDWLHEEILAKRVEMEHEIESDIFLTQIPIIKR